MAKKISALVPWFGSNRTGAHVVGQLLAGCRHVTIPFAGSLCEVKHLEAKTLLVNDLHRHVINVARVTAHPVLRKRFRRELRQLPLHPDVLAEAQDVCRNELPGDGPDVRLAVHYFRAAWMGRNGMAGKPEEFNQSVCVRRDAGGGDSAKRFQSAVDALRNWERSLARCTFTTEDALDVIRECLDKPRLGLYCDPPFPDVGRYVHSQDYNWHRRLAKQCRTFEHTRVVMRFYDHPLVRKLYKERHGWVWLEGKGKKASNKLGPEVLLVLNGAK